jgi:hypothetical protein
MELRVLCVHTGRRLFSAAAAAVAAATAARLKR